LAQELLEFLRVYPPCSSVSGAPKNSRALLGLCTPITPNLVPRALIDQNSLPTISSIVSVIMNGLTPYANPCNSPRRDFYSQSASNARKTSVFKKCKKAKTAADRMPNHGQRTTDN
jgi:hypothetical protein